MMSDAAHAARPRVPRPPATRGIWKELSARDLIRVPGLLSLSRVPLAAVFPLTLGHPALEIGVLGTAGITDVLDGWYARRFHQETRTGAALDGLTDKVFVLTVVGSLAAFGAMSLVEVLLLGTREIGEAALAVRLAADPERRRRATVRKANLAGKLATTLQFAAVSAIVLGLEQRSLLVGATALAGVVASAMYWTRDVAAARPAAAR